jgi:hypothetical protein
LRLVLLCAAISPVLRLNLHKADPVGRRHARMFSCCWCGSHCAGFTHARAGLTLLIISVMMALAVREVPARREQR